MPSSLRTIKDEDGVLVPIEFNLKEIPFEPKRVFYVTNVPKGEVRGNHAHFETEQLLICIQGLIEVQIEYSNYVVRNCFLEPHTSAFVPKLAWDSQRFLTGKDVLLVICSTHYDPQDYIEDKDEFKRVVFQSHVNR
jgi:dTDP-4-dehydrorhamnose 3,5-epimerase-like enzyme